MKKRRFLIVLCVVFEIAAILTVLSAVGWLTYRYIQYGEERSDQKENRDVDAEAVNNTAKISGEQSEIANSQTEGMDKSNEQESVNEEEKTDVNIRVRILSEDYRRNSHESVALTCDSEYTVIRDGERTELPAGEKFQIEKTELAQSEVVCIEPTGDEPLELLSLKRADGYPEYAGCLYLYRVEDGLALVNELPLETYLCSVVSSEMPSDYPLEAQKAQAVCARTYAWNCIRAQERLDMLADLDDSVMYQVYNNYGSSIRSSQAVCDTSGQILPVEEALYYSTSCLSEQKGDLDSDEAFACFLEDLPTEKAEYDSPWIRWTVVLETDGILQNILEQNASCGLDSLETISVLERNGNGQVQKLRLTDGEHEFVAEGEYQIRCILGTENTEIILKDESSVTGMNMLPSAFFVLEEVNMQEGTVKLRGGGYGHGIGMSQCGAAQMAENGLDYREILSYYYGVEIVQIDKDRETR